MIRNGACVATAVAAVSLAVMTPSVALAQRASAQAMSSAPVVPAAGRRAVSTGIRVSTSRHSSSARSSMSATNTPRHSADAFGFGGGFPLSLQDLLNITPNNGFDWQYVNSINQDLAIKALIDPVTQLEVAQAERLLRSTGGVFGGAYIFGGGGYYVPPEAEEGAQPQEEAPEAQPTQGPQPQIIVLQQAPAQQAAPQTPPPEQPLPDRGPFTLVLRSGKEIQAVAFTHSKGRIVYITPDGGRLSIAAAELDPAATMRINEERGTPLQLPL
jgi:hypothetical protein